MYWVTRGLASQKVGVSEGLTQHKVPTMSSQMAMDLACHDFSSKLTVTTSPFQSILVITQVSCKWL